MTSEGWNTSNKHVSSKEGSQVDKNVEVVFVGKETENDCTNEGESSKNSPVFIDSNDNESVKSESKEESSSNSSQNNGNLSDFSKKPCYKEGSSNS